MKVFAYWSAWLGYNYVTEGRQTEQAHEIFMNMHIVVAVVGQR